MATLKVLDDAYSQWHCEPCGQALQLMVAELQYLDSHFNVELPTCPKCGFVLIPESLALGKMAQVEHLLEDK